MQFLSYLAVIIKTKTNIRFKNGVKMKAKSVLKFYFRADSLNAAIDGLIMKRAFSHASPSEGAEAIIGLIEQKKKLGGLWRYLDGVMEDFSEGDRRVLRYYGCTQKRVPPEMHNEVRRVTVRFFRHARRLGSYAEGLKLVEGYYCLLSFLGR